MAAKTHQHCTKITMETVDLLCNLLLQKVPQKEICQATGISQASLTIYVNFLAYHGKEVFIDHYINGNKPEYTDEQYNQIVECMIKHNLSLTAICAMFRIHKDPIKQRLAKRGDTPFAGVIPAEIPASTDSEFMHLGFRSKEGKAQDLKSTNKKAANKYTAPTRKTKSTAKKESATKDTTAKAAANDIPINEVPAEPAAIVVDEKGFDQYGNFRGIAKAPVKKYRGSGKGSAKATQKTKELEASEQISTLEQMQKQLKNNPVDFLVRANLSAKDWSKKNGSKTGRPRDIDVFSVGFDKLPREVQIKSLHTALNSAMYQLIATTMAYEFELDAQTSTSQTKASPKKKDANRLPSVSKLSKFKAVQAITAANDDQISQAKLCEFLGIKANDITYLRSVQNKAPKEDNSRDLLKQIICEIFNDIGKGTWGHLRITKFMRTSPDPKYRFNVSAGTVKKYMKELNLVAKQ